MKKIFYIIILFILGCTTDTKIIAEKYVSDNLFQVTIDSSSLKNNLIDDKTEIDIYALLPPSYNISEKRYPVVYHLHGFGGSATQIFSFIQNISSTMSKGIINEFIFVCVSGSNKLGGSFYVNSEVTGNWEDYFLKEVVTLIDSRLRTIPGRESRGISGFSMGGYAALNIAIKHPDIFSVCYALCPGIFDKNGLINAIETWDNNFLNAYGAAFSPNTSRPYPFADIPVFDGSDSDNKIIFDWENGFGNMEEKLQDYLKQDILLNAIRIDYSTNDKYRWITEGCIYFSGLLKQSYIEHEFVELATGHTINGYIIQNNILPFFSDKLKFN